MSDCFLCWIQALIRYSLLTCSDVGVPSSSGQTLAAQHFSTTCLLDGIKHYQPDKAAACVLDHIDFIMQGAHLARLPLDGLTVQHRQDVVTSIMRLDGLATLLSGCKSKAQSTRDGHLVGGHAAARQQISDKAHGREGGRQDQDYGSHCCPAPQLLTALPLPVPPLLCRRHQVALHPGHHSSSRAQLVCTGALVHRHLQLTRRMSTVFRSNILCILFSENNNLIAFA